MRHIPQHLFERFIEGRAIRAEARQVLIHLLRGCHFCAARALGVYRPAVSEPSYDDIFDRVTHRLVAEWGSVELPALRKVSVCSLW